MTKLAIIYYSATGHGTTMAHRIAASAEEAGAEVRVRPVAETRDPTSFAQNPAWTANYAATKDLPQATGEDIVWADAVIFGSPTRFGSVASQLRIFLDSLGALWAERQARRQGLRGVHIDEHRTRRPRNDASHAVRHTDALRRDHRAARIHRCVEVRRWKPVRGQPHGRPRQHQRVRRCDERCTGPHGPPSGQCR